MAEETLVSMQIDDGARIVERLRESGFNLIAAWWMKAREEGLWFLYIATPDVEEKGIVAAYRTVLDSMDGLGQTWVDRFEVKVVGAENRITKDVVSHLLIAAQRRLLSSLHRIGVWRTMISFRLAASSGGGFERCT